MKKIELLSPVGDYNCLKAAVQNGANAVYLGVSDFNARNSATNFTLEDLKSAINYSHLRNVKVYLTLNTLIKNSEISNVVNIAKNAYENGIDGVIIQDIGLANILSQNIPNLPLHASTQMTCHNLEGAKYLERLGFKRIVLSRELSIKEIEYIKSNINIEIEVFIHGALCICYSGQCLYSSLIGGRSGNRGKCAQGCRLPYTLLENNETINKGFLLSPRDLCSLDLLPNLISSDVDSLKIEGRMKSPEYVATVTRIYRKYLDIIYNNEEYVVESNDKKELEQVFNRGGFSTGHLLNEPNKKLIFKDKPNNMGICIGNVYNYNSNKGHISFTLNDTLSIGDIVSFEHEESKYTISELMKGNTNCTTASKNQRVTIGRMKGKINKGDKIFKLSDKLLNQKAKESYSFEKIKQPISAELNVLSNSPISLRIYNDNYDITLNSNELPEKAMNMPITKERLKKQLNKLTDTPFYFKEININLDGGLFVPHISAINELRRNAINEFSKKILKNDYRNIDYNYNEIDLKENISKSMHTYSLLLNKIDTTYDYTLLENVDRLYIPLLFFNNEKYLEILKYLTNNFNTYIFLPNILKDTFKNVAKSIIQKTLLNYKIKGFVIGNISYISLLSEYKNNYEFIGNYTLNIFNNFSINSLNLNSITISPELNKNEINQIANNSIIPTEFIIYGKLPLMTLNYCLLGQSNKCYFNCDKKCLSYNEYYLKDRMKFLFRIVPDNTQTLTTIYNTKTTFILPSEINYIDTYRIDILDESITEINTIINNSKNNTRLEGKEYTNGNLNRTI